MSASLLPARIIAISALIVGIGFAYSPSGAGKPDTSGGKTEPTVYHLAGAALNRGPCGTATKVTSLTVSRTVLFPTKPGTSSTYYRPLTNRAAAQGVLQLLCELPLVPKGPVYNCPLDRGIGYSLVFRLGKRGLFKIAIDASGCRIVTGLKLERFATPELWSRLAHTLRLPIGLSPA